MKRKAVDAEAQAKADIRRKPDRRVNRTQKPAQSPPAERRRIAFYNIRRAFRRLLVYVFNTNSD